ncbi:MAG: hypothetical protein M1830_006167 [Pleopsidium flavum]|nr:MAG: hypothetical protein M1830_006167 [Pleopsidium flavum]
MENMSTEKLSGAVDKSATSANTSQENGEASFLFHLNTLWLFTCNDLKSIVGPETAFGIFSALSGPLMTTNESPDFSTIVSRIPRVILWLWLNLLLFNISNQSLPGSVIEDSINKPWRPLPSKRLSLVQARRLLLAIIPAVFITTLYLGGMEVSVVLMVLTWMYNDLGGADENYVIRNLLNLFGFVCYSLGALMVACDQRRFSLTPAAYQWLTIVGLIVLTTLQTQDLSDQEGDRARGRRTIPLIMGDWTARWTIALPVVAWSFFCPAFWKLGIYSYIIPVAIGGLVAFRVLMIRSVAGDKLSWKMWCLWTVSLYLLPLCKNHTVLVQSIKYE